ncbi:MAG: heme NO-binding domain-containing protein [Candidatus Doudnabacteria bacterium]|nr:heme NO-binding domain-containing protein [Candidatus Doudnabacteria bacterium]
MITAATSPPNQDSNIETLRMLHKYCSRPINDVNDVCIIIVLVRKVIESYKPNEPYPMVNFHCNWALHISKYSEEVVNSFLTDIDNAAIQFHTDYSPDVLSKKIKVLAHMKNFGFELIRFIEDHKLPNVFIADNHNWFKFIKNYILLVIEAPLQVPEKFVYVKSFSFQRYGEVERQQTEFGEVVLNSTGVENAPINYFVEFKNGDTFSAEIKIPGE